MMSSHSRARQEVLFGQFYQSYLLDQGHPSEGGREGGRGMVEGRMENEEERRGEKRKGGV